LSEPDKTPTEAEEIFSEFQKTKESTQEPDQVSEPQVEPASESEPHVQEAEAQPPQQEEAEAQPPQQEEAEAQPPQQEEAEAQPPQQEEAEAQPPQQEEAEAQPPQQEEAESQPPQQEEAESQPPQQEDAESQPHQQKEDENEKTSVETKTKTEDSTGSERNIIYVGLKPLMTYVTATLTQLAIQPTVIIKARGKRITQAVDVSQMIVKRMNAMGYKISDVRISSDSLKSQDGKMRNVSTIEIDISKS